MTKMSVRKTVGLAAGLLAVASFAMAQDTTTQPPTNPDTSQTSPQTSASGGWRKVGDSSNTQISQSSTGGPTAAPNTYPDSNYPAPQAQPNYPQANPPQAGQQPMGPGPMQQGPMQQGYPQQPYAQQQYPQQQYPQQAPVKVPSQITVPAGTYVTVRVNQLLTSERNQVGDAFSATLTKPLVVDGVVLAEPGETLAGRVEQVQKSGHVSGLAKLGVELTDLTLVDGQQLPLKTTFVSRTADSSVGRDAGAIAGTTALGAAAGAAADWGRGAAIGAGAGAVVGIVGVLVTKGHPSVIYPEQQLTFKIEQPLTVSTDRAPQAFRYVQPNEYSNQMAYGPGPGYPPVPGYALAPGPYAYGYPYYGYPYYYPGFSFFVGPGFYGRGFYGPRFYGGRGFRR